MTNSDLIYINLLRAIKEEGDIRPSRNHPVQSHFGLPIVKFDSFPLVTVRRTAWKLAIKEMEWFLSGNPKCPDDLLGWWRDQLSPAGYYYGGYGYQLRNFNDWFDQVICLLESLNRHQNSRRLLLTTWNPADMSRIAEWNDNDKTPTTCHTTVAQFYVCGGKLSMKSYQRSADMLLGAQHNWVQSWALLMWLAQRARLDVGTMQWIFGDAHIYQEDSHLATLECILNAQIDEPRDSPALFLEDSIDLLPAVNDGDS